MSENHISVSLFAIADPMLAQVDVADIFSLRDHGSCQGSRVITDDGDGEVHGNEERAKDARDVDAHLRALVQRVVLGVVRG